MKLDEESLERYLGEGWKPYFHRATRRWYLRKGQKRKIIPRELEDLASRRLVPPSKIFVDVRKYHELEKGIADLRSEIKKFEVGEVDLGTCPTCNRPVKLKEVKEHMRHVIEKPVERIVERIVEKPEIKVVEKFVESPELGKYKERARWAEEGSMRFQAKCQELEDRLRSLVAGLIPEFIRTIDSKIDTDGLADIIDHEIQRRGLFWYDKGQARDAAKKVIEQIANTMKGEWEQMINILERELSMRLKPEHV